MFSQFQAPPLDDADFSAKPMIMVIGQYSVGEFGMGFMLDVNLNFKIPLFFETSLHWSPLISSTFCPRKIDLISGLPTV